MKHLGGWGCMSHGFNLHWWFGFRISIDFWALDTKLCIIFLILLYIYLDILYNIHILFIHIYYLYSMVSTDTDHIRFLQIVIDDSFLEAWRGRMGALTGSLPKEVGVHRHQWEWEVSSSTPCKELLDGQQNWNEGDSRSMAIGPNRTPFFGQSYVRSFFWNWSTIWMSARLHIYIYIYA